MRIKRVYVGYTFYNDKDEKEMLGNSGGSGFNVSFRYGSIPVSTVFRKSVRFSELLGKHQKMVLKGMSKET